MPIQVVQAGGGPSQQHFFVPLSTAVSCSEERHFDFVHLQTAANGQVVMLSPPSGSTRAKSLRDASKEAQNQLSVLSNGQCVLIRGDRY